jgi:hypothetical protein
MTADEFNDALRYLRLSVYASAPILGISLRQAQRYAAGEQIVAAPIAALLTMTVDMIKRWKDELRKAKAQVELFDSGKFYARVNNKDATAEFSRTGHLYVRKWEKLLRDPGNGLPPQIDLPD